jgi:hypothetical protein
MFRALLAHLQEALRERRFGDHRVLKIDNKFMPWRYLFCRMICIQYAYVLLVYIGLGISKSENAVSVLLSVGLLSER